MPREPVDASILNTVAGVPDWAGRVSIIPMSNPTDFLPNGYFIVNGVILDEFCSVTDKFPGISPPLVQFRSLGLTIDFKT